MWRYYVQRPTSKLWLDTNAQLADVNLAWIKSAPKSGKALVPSGIGTGPIAEDGRPVWGKWDTILLAEEDGELKWGGICTAANPDDKGLQLEFVGPIGWLQHVDYSDHLLLWQTDVFDVVRHLVYHAMAKPDSLSFSMPTTHSMFTVGDPQPPNQPVEPPRARGETEAQWKDSPRYNAYQVARDNWNELYKDYQQFEIGWFEGPYVGEEIDTLAKETGFDYRERVEWVDRSALEYRFYLDFADNMVQRRTDIAFVDGVNLAKPLDPKDGNEQFANRVIGLGAGDGRDMARVTAGGSDGRLYQAEYMQYKSIANTNRLQSLVQADHAILNNKNPKIDSLVVWDVPGFVSLSTLEVGDEVMVKSNSTSPPIETWVRIYKITRDPQQNVVVVMVETV